MCRSLGPKPIAVFRERSVPAPLQYLHHRLLDEAIKYRRNAQLAHSAVRLRDFHPFHWLWCVGSVEELFADDWPVLFQVSRQFLDGHPVNAWAAFVGLHCRSACLQFSRSQTSSIHCSVVGLSALRFANSDSVPPSKAVGAAPLLSSEKARQYWLFCRLSVVESRRVLIAPFIPLRGPFGPSLLSQLLRPLLTPAT